MRPISERQSAPVGDILPPTDARRNLFADNKQRSVCPSVRRTSSLTYCRPQLSSLGLVMRSTCLCPPVSQPSLYPMESRPFTPPPTYLGWRRGVVVSGVCRMNEVNARRARLVLGWVTVFGPGIPSRYVTSQLGQLSLAF